MDLEKISDPLERQALEVKMLLSEAVACLLVLMKKPSIAFLLSSRRRSVSLPLYNLLIPIAQTQIMEFGQTPKQLFTLPHPQRRYFDHWFAFLFSIFSLFRSVSPCTRLVFLLCPSQPSSVSLGIPPSPMVPRQGLASPSNPASTPAFSVPTEAVRHSR